MKKFDVLGVGNAIVDVLGFVDDKFLSDNSIQKGMMSLIDEATAEKLYNNMGQATEVSGGCAGNTVAGIVSLGGHAAYIGRVKKDSLGDIFTHDMNGVGVSFNSQKATSGKATARSFIFVTPDAERSMMTYLGACTEFDESYVDEDLICDSKVVYIEGYLWDEPKAKAAIRKVLELAKKHGTKVSFTLSDPFCVERHREEFLFLLSSIDILFCNEHEAKALFKNENIHECVARLTEKCEVVAVTRGAHGSIVSSGDFMSEVAPSWVEKPMDSTGAGDLFAAGFLYGYTQGKQLAECGRIGSIAAAEIIKQLGARPMKPLKQALAA
jgi:sugar/nucleoside kinase (ribokinase family)